MVSSPLLTRLANLVSRVVLRRVDDSKRMQLVQLTALEGETRADVERVQQYGFTSVPKDGAEAVALFPGGFREHGFVIATDDRRYRLTGLQAGEVAIYTDQGDKVVIERGGTIRVTASTKVVVAAPLVELAGNADAVALASKVNDRLAHLEAAFNAHMHPTAALGPPSPPVPVPGQIPVESPLPAGSGVVGSVASTKVKAE